MRTRISDKNIMPVFDLENEYKKIRALCFNKDAFGAYTMSGVARTRLHISYDDLLNYFFLDWPLRGSFTSIEEMLFSLAISEDDFEKEVTEERLLDFIQFTINAVRFLDRVVKSGKYTFYTATSSVGKAILENCCFVAQKLGTEIKEEKNEIYLVYKDDIATAVCNEIPETEASITEYQKIDSRGDLTRKMEILCSLAKRLEPFEKVLSSNGYKSLCTDTTFLLNKVARHELNNNYSVDKMFINMDDKTKELWCDRAFHMFLGCMAILPYIDIKKEIEKIKRAD